MSTARFSLLALPHSSADDAEFHVSLFVGPRLSDDGTLADYPLFADWAALLLDAGTTIELVDQSGVAYTVALVSSPEPPARRAVFPPTTPVKGWATKTPPVAGAVTYDTRAVEGIAKTIPLLTLAADPVNLPSPSQSPLGP